ncbi:MAG TPA: HEAT repeat domain-containing protein [Spirochaetota bacterium]|nr:HEAT repeat domain-containing protein [Spirochaetota bacterium]HNT12587.1 HEAT repeat domain-containing protein [Spirochaetota bacterium]HNV48747.1 HEAT repeat domain-containing protein [Spirochaetota bacterium]HOS39919.1 HEAT repeat domain-containing protein [Spirochaetota bacterium]HPI23794.1 HEAT repeat domain-containing protein [Spirochaetota bacterium]
MKKFLISFVSVFMLISFLNAQDAAKKEEKPKTTKEYINDLGSTDENAIVKACDYLGQKEEKDAIPKLLPLLKDSGKSAQVRMWSAIALGLIGDEKTLDPLAESVQKDSSADVRYSAILAMSRIGVKDKKYLELFKDRMNGDPDPFIRDYLTKLYEKAGGK